MRAGLTADNRSVLTALNRAFPGPFTIADASAAAELDPERAARLLRHLAEQGWLARVRRGLYATVPLDAERPEDWQVDPWAIAARALDPGYVGGWTALNHWDLSEQLFASTVFLTARSVRRRKTAIGGARFELRHRDESTLFGLRRVWRSGLPVSVSNRERTLVDCLDDPALGGGLRHVSEALVHYVEGESERWDDVLDYGDRLGNQTVFKRLGYLAETLGFGDRALLESCRARVSAGIGRLDPALPARGAVVTRWGLRVNASVAA